MKTIKAHIFRVDGTDHIIVTTAGKVHRGKGKRFICALPIGTDAVHVTAFTKPCPGCDTAFNGFVDACDAPPKVPTHGPKFTVHPAVAALAATFA